MPTNDPLLNLDLKQSPKNVVGIVTDLLMEGV